MSLNVPGFLIATMTVYLLTLRNLLRTCVRFVDLTKLLRTGVRTKPDPGVGTSVSTVRGEAYGTAPPGQLKTLEHVALVPRVELPQQRPVDTGMDKTW